MTPAFYYNCQVNKNDFPYTTTNVYTVGRVSIAQLNKCE